MAISAISAMMTMYQAGATVDPVAAMSAVEIMAAVPPKMALARLKLSAKPV